MADQIYTAALDYSQYNTGIDAMDQKTNQFKGSFERTMDQGVRRQTKAATEDAGGSTLKFAVRMEVLARTARLSFNIVRDSMRAYGETSEFARREVTSLGAAFAGVQAGLGRDWFNVLNNSELFSNGGAMLKGLESFRQRAVDTLAEVMTGAPSGSATRARDQELAGEHYQKMVAAEVKSVELERSLNLSLAQVVDQKDRAAVLAAKEAAAAEVLRQRTEAVGKLEDLRAERRAELVDLANREYTAVTGRALREKMAAEEESSRQSQFQVRQAEIDRIRAEGRLGEADSAQRQLDQQQRSWQIQHQELTDLEKSAALKANFERSAAQELEARRNIADQAKDAAAASFLAAKQTDAFTKDAAGILGQRLAMEKELETLRRQGASDEQLRTVELLQRSELEALTLEAARSGVKNPKAARLDAGLSGFLSQTFGGGSSANEARTIATNTAKLNKQVDQLTDQLRRISDKLDGVGSLR